MKANNIFLWLVRLIAAVILLQTLYFKFTAAPESVFIFSELGLEPEGRILIGLLELVTGILLLVPRVSWIGAVLGIGLMVGAIFSHVTRLGIEVQDDGGLLFYLALTVLACCLVIAWTDRKQIPVVNRYFTR